jgi:RHS repeat-associated protein
MKKSSWLGLLVLAGSLMVPTAQAATSLSAQEYDLFVGDFNGDGRDDILYIAKNAAHASGIALSDASGEPSSPLQSWPSTYLGITWSTTAFSVHVADYNGDGHSDILLQANTANGNSYLLFANAQGQISAINQTISASTAGLTWSSDQHQIVVGDFNGDGKADVFLQATSTSGTNAVVLADGNGQFTSASPAQQWGNSYLGLKWSTQNANVYAGDFNGAQVGGHPVFDLLVQARPTYVLIDFDPSIVVPGFPPNMNGIVLSQGAGLFGATGERTWSRGDLGADWSPLDSNVIIGRFDTSACALCSSIILQGRQGGRTSFLLSGNSGSVLSNATTLSSNEPITADKLHLLAGNFGGGSSAGLYLQALTPDGTNFISGSVSGSTIVAIPHDTYAITNPTSPPPSNSVAGRTSGTFNVSSNGAAQYTIPIWAPPGPGGVQPDLTLSYSSQGRSGFLGVGWSLTGLSSIYRCNATYAQDAAPAPVNLSASDAYCMDGQRLRLTGGTYGAAGSTYQTEVANFTTVTAYGAAGNGPAYFIAQDRNAHTYYYGNGGNAQVLAPGTSTALSWELNEVSDPSGNTMMIAYNTANGSAVPATVSWTPSSYGSTHYSYVMTFIYVGNSPQGSYFGFKAGSAISNTNLLKSINVAYEGATVKQYVLGYQPSGVTSRELLNTVQECSDAGASNCLAPTTMSYQPGAAAGVATSWTQATLPSHSGTSYPLDANGDGIPDLLYSSAVAGTTTEHWYVVLGTGSGTYGSPIDTGATTNVFSGVHDSVLIGDLAGTGRDGILYPANGVSGNWNWAYLASGASSFTDVPTSTSAANEYLSILADVNGDGLPDLVYSTPTDGAHIYMLPNVTNFGGSVSFSTSPATLYTAPAGANAQVDDTSKTSIGHVRSVDFNGDGRADLIISVVMAPSGGRRYVWFYGLVSNGGPASAPSVTPVQLKSDGYIVDGSHYTIGNLPIFLDWNGDGCTDLVVSTSSGNAGVALSPCTGAVANITSWTTVSTDIGTTGFALTPIDWDGDGRTDLLWCNNVDLHAYVALSMGSSALPSTTTGFTTNSGVCSSYAADLNGDGQADLTEGGTYTAFHNPGGQPDLLAKVSDGYGNSVSPTYASIIQSNYAQSRNATSQYPPIDTYRYYIGPVYVVSQATFSDPSNPPNGTYYQTFSYYGAWSSLQGRGTMGFGQMQQYDSRNGIWDTRSYYLDFPYTGMLSSELVSADQPGSQQIRYTFTARDESILNSTAGNQRYFPYISNSTVQVNEVGGARNGQLISTITTSRNFDTYGNVLTTETTATDSDNNSPYFSSIWNTTTTNTPAVDAAHSCLGLSSRVQVVYGASIGATVTRTRQMTPDTTKCRYTQVVTEPDSSLYKVTEAFDYDSFGNIRTDTVTGIGMAARQTVADWGPNGQFPIAVTDPSGAKTQYSYNRSFGQPDSMTDANNLTTFWLYDGFGRKVQEYRPDRTSTLWSWPISTGCQAPFTSCGLLRNTVTRYDRDTSQNTISQSVVQLDPLERPFLVQQLNQTGSYSDVATNYDSLGRVASRSVPFIHGSTQFLETYSYDVLNRLKRSQHPVSATNGTLQSTTYDYQGRTETITDANGHAKTLIVDVNGWLRKTQDATGYGVVLGYDAAGTQTSTTDTQGNALSSATYQYGVAPFMVSSSDTDLGSWTYGYDALGEATTWHDGKGQNFSAAYDALSRMTDRYEPDLYSHWTWGSGVLNGQPAYNVGQLQSLCTGTGASPTTCTAASGYAENDVYDTFGRLSQRSIQIPGDATYNYNWSYNGATGQLDTLTYPANPYGNALRVKSTYVNGFLQSLTDVSDSPNVTFWTASSVDAAARLTQETLGNRVVVNHGIDAVTGRANNITAGLNGGTALQNNAYLFDNVGNLTQRQDNNRGLTENVYPDSLNRLDHTTLTAASGTSTNEQTGYDTLGRLQSLAIDGGAANVLDYATAQAGCPSYANAQLHAVRKSTQGGVAISYCYDANGNFTSDGAGNSVSWTSYNQPRLISGAWGSTQFAYDADHQRWQQTGTSAGSTRTITYIGNLMEKIATSSGTTYRYYVQAGNSKVVYSTAGAGSVSTYYVTGDHLGSNAVVSDNSGAPVVTENFSAWGRARGDNWTGTPTSAEVAAMVNTTARAFTGQEVLDASTLVNMNGRIYGGGMAPGRFLSPDTHIPDPTNTLSYNRYAYVNYNPLSSVDPSGFYNCTPTQVDTSDGDGSTERANNYQCAPDESSDIHFPAGTNFDPNGNNSFIFPAGTAEDDMNKAMQSLPTPQVTVTGTQSPGDFLYLDAGLSGIVGANLETLKLTPVHISQPQGNQDLPEVVVTTKTCTFDAEFSAVGPHQATGIGALGFSPPNDSVAISPAIFGLPYTTIAQRTSTQRAILANVGNIRINAPGLSDYLTGGTSFTIGDVGDANIRNSAVPRFDIYRFKSNADALDFGLHTVPTSVTGVPQSWSCPGRK